MTSAFLTTSAGELDLLGTPPDGPYLVEYLPPVVANSYTYIEGADAEGAEAVRFKPGNAKATGILRVDRSMHGEGAFRDDLDTVQRIFAAANTDREATHSFRLPGVGRTVEAEVVGAQLTDWPTNDSNNMTKRRIDLTFEIEVKPWGMLEEAVVPLWDSDSFSRDQMSEGRWLFKNGTSGATVSGGTMAPGNTNTQVIVRPWHVEGGEITLKYRTGPVTTNTQIGPVLKHIDDSNYVFAFFADSGALLYLYKTDATVQSVLASTGVATTMQANTDYWIRSIQEGSHLEAILYDRDPDVPLDLAVHDDFTAKPDGFFDYSDSGHEYGYWTDQGEDSKIRAVSGRATHIADDELVATYTNMSTPLDGCNYVEAEWTFTEDTSNFGSFALDYNALYGDSGTTDRTTLYIYSWGWEVYTSSGGTYTLRGGTTFTTPLADDDATVHRAWIWWDGATTIWFRTPDGNVRTLSHAAIGSTFPANPRPGVEIGGNGTGAHSKVLNWGAGTLVTPPELGGVSFDFTGGDATQFGTDTWGHPGIWVDAGDTSARIDDWRMQANSIRGNYPITDLEVRDLGGHVPAFAELTLTDTASQNRDQFEVGVENKHWDPADPKPVIIDSDQLVTSGFAGAQTNVYSGMFDPLAVGNTSIVATIGSVPVTICSTGPQGHIGRKRIKIRCRPASLSVPNELQFRLAWRVGDGPIRYEPWKSPSVHGVNVDLALAVIEIPEVASGSQQWIGYIQAVASASDIGVIDYVAVLPAEVFARAEAAPNADPLAFDGSDTFIQAAGSLGGKTADLGGTWDTTETGTDATDFAIETTLDTARRTATSDASNVGRVALLGSAVTDGGAQVDVKFSTRPAANFVFMAVVCRYVDMDNFFAACVSGGVTQAEWALQVFRMIPAGKDGYAGAVSLSGYWGIPNATYTLRLDCAADGSWNSKFFLNSIQVIDWSGVEPELATGGGLASGRRGIYDESTSATAINRDFDNYTSWVPEVDHLIYSQRAARLGPDYVSRENSGGTFSGRPPFEGNYLRIPPGNSRLSAEVRRNNERRAVSIGTTDFIELALTARERVLLT